MATFTMELWEVLELQADPGFADPTSDAAGGTIGLGVYPIFDESHRTILNAKILDRYWDREIGMETIAKFTLALRRRMNEIMPYYNQLYESELIKFDPLATFGLTTTRNDSGNTTGKRDSSSGSTSTASSASRSQSSETPQNELPDGWEQDADYATGGAASQTASNGSATSTGTDSSNATTSAQGTSTTTGFQGSAADLLGKFRAQIINIDTAILSDLNQLFMGIWDNNEEQLPPQVFQVGSLNTWRGPAFHPTPIPNLENEFIEGLH